MYVAQCTRGRDGCVGMELTVGEEGKRRGLDDKGSVEGKD